MTAKAQESRNGRRWPRNRRKCSLIYVNFMKNIHGYGHYAVNRGLKVREIAREFNLNLRARSLPVALSIYNSDELHVQCKKQFLFITILSHSFYIYFFGRVTAFCRDL